MCLGFKFYQVQNYELHFLKKSMLVFLIKKAFKYLKNVCSMEYMLVVKKFNSWLYKINIRKLFHKKNW